MANLKNKQLPVEKLRWRCAPESLGFKTTDEIESCDEIIGQKRALRAIKLGLEVKSPGYNIFVTGLTGTGKTTTIKHFLESIEDGDEVPPDLCYVNNFKHPDSPRVLRLPGGQACHFANDMDELIRDLKRKLPQIIESEEFQRRSKKIIDENQKASKELFKKLDERISKEGFAIVAVEMGTVSRPEILPVVKGKVLPWDALGALVEKGEFDRKEYDILLQKHEALSEELQESLRESRLIEKNIRESLTHLKHQICAPVVLDSLNDLREKYSFESVSTYLDEVLEEILENLERFKEKEETAGARALPFMGAPDEDGFVEFKINVVVDNAALKQAPVIIETAPSYRNLFGTVERVVDRNGMSRTDFTKIKAGSLLKANGGYLVFNLLDALTEPGVWLALKRTLKNRKHDIQAYDPFYFYSSSGLKPQAIDLDVKVVVIGDVSLYQLLYFYDEDFRKVFKIRADFDLVMNNNKKAVGDYARLIRKICDDEQLLPVDNAGVAHVLEYGVRLAGRQNKLSTRFSDIADVLREAQYWALQTKSQTISAKHVQKALDEKVYRASMVEDKIQEMIMEGTLLIDCTGEKVGELNGLSVYDMGEYSFGRPTKITAQVSMGRAGLINVEREADLSGKTHNKGVLIIAGYLRGKYAQDKPLSMSASLAFEQSYSGVDGDSASSTEIYAILSELSGLALRQDIAVTGSVNQKGYIQPIGGVNQKIEGFFAVCKANKLTGRQGVMIPAQNIQDLMLKQEILDAVASEEFQIYAVKTIDEGIEILTGKPAGKPNNNGEYPAGSVNRLVNDRLMDLARGLKNFAHNEKSQ